MPACLLRTAANSPLLPCWCVPCRQVIIMFFLGGIFKVERLSGVEWLVSMLIGMGHLPCCFLTKFVVRQAKPEGGCLCPLPCHCCPVGPQLGTLA